MCNLKITGPVIRNLIYTSVSQDPGTISKLFSLYKSVGHRHQPDMVRYHGYLSAVQDRIVQGDPSGCSLGMGDIKKVALGHNEHILNHSIYFDANKA